MLIRRKNVLNGNFEKMKILWLQINYKIIKNKEKLKYSRKVIF